MDTIAVLKILTKGHNSKKDEDGVMNLATTYVFIEKQETLSFNYPQYPLLSGALNRDDSKLC